MSLKKYIVTGNSSVTVSINVYAENEEEAMEKAASQFKGIRAYAGNGGFDKLIGVEGSGESISADCPVEFDDVIKD